MDLFPEQVECLRIDDGEKNGFSQCRHQKGWPQNQYPLQHAVFSIGISGNTRTFLAGGKPALQMQIDLSLLRFWSRPLPATGRRLRTPPRGG
jgi:hypothetical protein